MTATDTPMVRYTRTVFPSYAKCELFFGCTAFYRHKAIPTTINLQQGLNLLKDKNKLEVTNDRDLEDEY